MQIIQNPPVTDRINKLSLSLHKMEYYLAIKKEWITDTHNIDDS